MIDPPAREPILNLPPVTGAMVAVLAAIEFLRSVLLSPDSNLEMLITFAFIPARYLPAAATGGFVFPGGLAGDVWTFFTYAALHGGWVHVIVNSVWLVAFGSAVERRFGAVRYLALSLVCAAAGAAAHLLTHFGEAAPLVGASAAVAGQMGAAARFVFAIGGPAGAFGHRGDAAFRRPARSLAATFTDRTALAFIGIWLLINFATGLTSVPTLGDAGTIAWQAHVGGFAAGLLLFRFFDPVARR